MEVLFDHQQGNSKRCIKQAFLNRIQIHVNAMQFNWIESIEREVQKIVFDRITKRKQHLSRFWARVRP